MTKLWKPKDHQHVVTHWPCPKCLAEHFSCDTCGLGTLCPYSRDGFYPVIIDDGVPSPQVLGGARRGTCILRPEDYQRGLCPRCPSRPGFHRADSSAHSWPWCGGLYQVEWQCQQ